MMRKCPSSFTSNPNSMVMLEDPSSKSGSSSSGCSGFSHNNHRKRSRPGIVKRQDSTSSCTRYKDVDRLSDRSKSSDYYEVVCFSDRCTAKSQSWMYTAFIILLGGAACTTVLVLGLQSAHHSSQKLFHKQAEEVVFSVTSAWREFETVLLWITSFCDLLADDNTTLLLSSSSKAASPIQEKLGFCSRADFNYLMRQIDSLELPVVSIQFVPNITQIHRPALEEETALYYESLTLSSMSNHTVYPYMGITDVMLDPTTGTILERIPAAEQPFYFPVHYMYPLLKGDRSHALIDMDLYRVPEIRDHIDKALSSFQSVMEDRFPVPSGESSTTKGEDDNAGLWAVGVIHPGNNEYVMEDGGTTEVEEKVLTRRHHGISRVVFRPADLLQYSVSSLSFPEDGGVVVYIFDTTERRAAYSDEQQNPSRYPTFLAGVGRLDDGTLQYLNDVDFSTVEDLKTYSFQNAQFHEAALEIADHQWTIVVVPTGQTYWPRFDFVVLGSFLLFLATIVVTCLYHRSVERADQMRSLKSEQTREKAKIALLQAQQERHLVRMKKKKISALFSLTHSCLSSYRTIS
jgi:hypothetical protein